MSQFLISQWYALCHLATHRVNYLCSQELELVQRDRRQLQVQMKTLEESSLRQAYTQEKHLHAAHAQTTTAMSRELQASFRRVAGLERQLKEKNAQLKDKESQLKDQDARLALKDAQLAEQDAELAEQDAEIVDKQAEASQKNKLAAQFAASQRRLVTEAEAAAHELDARLKRVKYLARELSISRKSEARATALIQEACTEAEEWRLECRETEAKAECEIESLQLELRSVGASNLRLSAELVELTKYLYTCNADSKAENYTTAQEQDCDDTPCNSHRRSDNNSNQKAAYTQTEQLSGDITRLKAWMANIADRWICKARTTPSELSKGHALVYEICTQARQPKDAENQCYMLYLDYCRGICGQLEGPQKRAALQALKTIFKYVDQHFTRSKDGPQVVRTKLPTSKLCAGQDLKTAANAIAADPLWIPDYQASPAAGRASEHGATSQLSQSYAEIFPVQQSSRAYQDKLREGRIMRTHRDAMTELLAGTTMLKPIPKSCASAHDSMMKELLADTVQLKPVQREPKGVKTFREMLLLGLTEMTAHRVTITEIRSVNSDTARKPPPRSPRSRTRARMQRVGPKKKQDSNQAVTKPVEARTKSRFAASDEEEEEELLVLQEADRMRYSHCRGASNPVAAAVMPKVQPNTEWRGSLIKMEEEWRRINVGNTQPSFVCIQHG